MPSFWGWTGLFSVFVSKYTANIEQLENEYRAIERKTNAERMNCECLLSLKAWEILTFPSVQISPLWSVANVCNCGAYDKPFWSNLYKSGAIRQTFKHFPFANDYLVKLDRALAKWNRLCYSLGM